MSWLKRILQSNQDLDDRMKDVEGANTAWRTRYVTSLTPHPWIVRCVGGPLDGRTYPAAHIPTSIPLADESGSYVLQDSTDAEATYAWRRHLTHEIIHGAK